MPEALLKITDVMGLTKLSRAMVYQLIIDGKFAQPLKQGTGSYWTASDVDQYINGLKLQRSA